MNTSPRGDRCKCGRTLSTDETRCPKCGQVRIDFSARGDQLRLLRSWRTAKSYPTYDGRTISGPTVKTVLKAIDDIVGEENAKRRFRGEPTTQAHPIKRQRLMDDTGYCLNTVRRAVRVLSDHLCILDAEETRIGESPGHILMIDWALFSELVSSPPADVFSRPDPMLKTGSQRVSTCPQKASHLPTGDFHLPTGEFHPPTVGRSSLYAINAYTHPPNPPRGEPVEREGISELIRRTAAAEVYAAGTLIPHAVTACGLPHVAELVEHFERHRTANRWDAQRLATRLKNATPEIPPTEGWGEQKGRQTPRQSDLAELEARHGQTLDRLDKAAFLELAREVITDPAPLAMVRNFGEAARSLPAVRVPMLKHLAQLPRQPR